ncbi:hypothetical protein J7443_23420 [Tropicibacter sp. R15_0]|uniref:methyl-accepting chemotaxis protein n=1 Tax=Tropicibacter sp. R15_0 TaxID=2821101 RepID=UPI001ADC8A54|nr:methyl-accepting chemotaxis protein [Tropicibacter sp. R15_0]MBO9468196.1 hypothetical protein [Tropicibacter sp. R15_0]
MTDTTPTKSRKRSFFHSIFFRCSATMAITTIMVAATLSIGALNLLDRFAVEGVNRQVDNLAASAVGALQKPLRFNVANKVDEITLQTLHSAGDNATEALVLGKDGAVLSQSAEEGSALRALATQALESGVPERADNGRLVAYPVSGSPDGPAFGVFAIASSYEAQRAVVARSVRGVVLLAVVVFTVMMGLTLLLLHRMVGRPLTRLSDCVAQVEQGDYLSPTGMDQRPDEIGAIAKRVDSLREVLSAGRTSEEERATLLDIQKGVVLTMGKALDRLAEGILYHQIDDRFDDDNEPLRVNFNRASGNLHALVRDVAKNAEFILNNANRMSTASHELSQRTETQAATLEQSAAALEQMLNTVKSVAENTAQADENVQKTREIALKNGSVMTAAVEAMDQIQDSSKKISEITSMIDDIAFQTNLLALNAGVEAARAGESGSGFAVVASEVRALAQRSSEAAQQIKGLIMSSSEQVQSGAELVQAAGTALDEVLSEVEEIANMMNGLASSAGEQAEGLNEVNVGISNLDRVTQQNASMVIEASTTAQELSASAKELGGLVGRFSTEKDKPENHDMAEKDQGSKMGSDRAA